MQRKICITFAFWCQFNISSSSVKRIRRLRAMIVQQLFHFVGEYWDRTQDS
jgi:hypothetical protein